MFNHQANQILQAYYNEDIYPVWLNNLLRSYEPTGPTTVFTYDYFPEHYYGNLINQPFAVFLSHNPGGELPEQHINAPTANHDWFFNTMGGNYHRIVSAPDFPAQQTHAFIT